MPAAEAIKAGNGKRGARRENSSEEIR